MIIVKKLLLSCTLLTIAFSSGTSAWAATASVSLNQDSFVPIQIDFQALQAVSSSDLATIDHFVHVNENDLLEIDPKAKKELPKKVYATLLKGVSTINTSLQNGNYKMEQNRLVRNQPQTVDDQSKTVRTAATASSYWWGVHLGFNNIEAKQFANILTSSANTWGLAALIAGFVPGGQATAVASGIIAYGASELSRKVSYANTGRGVWVDIGWVPAVTNVYSR